MVRFAINGWPNANHYIWQNTVLFESSTDGHNQCFQDTRANDQDSAILHTRPLTMEWIQLEPWQLANYSVQKTAIEVAFVIALEQLRDNSHL